MLLYLLLILNVGCCTENYTFVTKTAAVGQNATLMCPCEKSLYQETLYWIRLVSGNWPEFLGATFTFQHDVTTKAPHIKAKLREESFILHINGAKLSDTGLYYCVKVKQLDMVFINGAFLEIKGPESGMTAVIQEPPSDLVRLRDPESLQCSVLSDAGRKTCSADHRVYWFRAGSDQSHPSLIYAHGNSGGECERSSEDESVQKCVYSFSDLSDSGTYYCAVAACGQILFGNGQKLDLQGIDTGWDTGRDTGGISTYLELLKDVIVLICIILAILAVPICVIILIHLILVGDADHGHSGALKNLQRVENKEIYTAVVFTVINAASGEMKDPTAETQKIDAVVKTLLQDSHTKSI